MLSCDCWLTVCTNGNCDKVNGVVMTVCSNQIMPHPCIKRPRRALEAAAGVEPAIKVLQTFALPLGYAVLEHLIRTQPITLLLLLQIVSIVSSGLMAEGLRLINAGAWVSGIRKARFRPLHCTQPRSSP